MGGGARTSARLQRLADALAHVRVASERFEQEDGHGPTPAELVAAAILIAGFPEGPEADDPASEGPSCPECHAPMWDNRNAKESGQRSPKAPDFKCKRQDCGKGIWLTGPHDLPIVFPNHE